MARSDEALGDGLGDLLMDFVDGEIAFNEDNALRLAHGNLAVLVPDALIEGFLLLLEAVFVVTCLSGYAVITPAGSLQADGKGRQEEQGEVWLQIAADEPVQVEDDLGAELATSTLIGLSGVREAVTKDELACGQGWIDNFGDGLCTVGEHEGHFGHGCETSGT